MCSSNGKCVWIGCSLENVLEQEVKRSKIKMIYEEEMQKRNNSVRSLKSLNCLIC